jgi:ArsR family transcriptional regulator, virulence genes transcriptional regulator
LSGNLDATALRTTDWATECADIHRVLANRRRLMIAWMLAGRELSVTEIAHAIGASLQSTSQHLRLMRDHSMLSWRRTGRTVYYRLHRPDCLPVSLWPIGPSHEAGPRIRDFPVEEEGGQP